MKNILYITFLALAFTACSSGHSGDKKAELEELKKQEATLKEKISALEAEIAKNGNVAETKSTEVVVKKLEVKNFKHFVEVQAKVDGDDNVFISPQMQGIVKDVRAKAGESVKKGTVLVQLDDQVYVKSLDELNASRNFLNTLYLKQKALWDQKIGTEIQYLTAKNNLESLDNKIATVREQLDMTRIKSPINGNVDLIDVKVGQALAPGLQNIRVVNFEKLKIQAEVAESYISKINKGDEVEVYFPDLDQTIVTTLTYSGKVIDVMNRTFRVEVLMSAKNLQLHPNMVAVLRIADYKKDNSIVLPVSVVQNTPNGSYVFVSENNKAVKRVVTTGRNYRGEIEILTGLQAGDPVIIDGFQNIVDGQSIKI